MNCIYRGFHQLLLIFCLVVVLPNIVTTAARGYQQIHFPQITRGVMTPVNSYPVPPVVHSYIIHRWGTGENTDPVRSSHLRTALVRTGQLRDF